MKEFIDGNEAIEFSPHQLAKLRSPGVYIYLVEDKAIYIGATSNGLCRAIDNQHHKYDELKKIQDLGLIFIPCKNSEAAFELEAKLVMDLQPDLNARLKLDVAHVTKLLGIEKSTFYRNYGSQRE